MQNNLENLNLNQSFWSIYPIYRWVAAYNTLSNKNKINPLVGKIWCGCKAECQCMIHKEKSVNPKKVFDIDDYVHSKIFMYAAFSTTKKNKKKCNP